MCRTECHHSGRFGHLDEMLTGSGRRRAAAYDSRAEEYVEKLGSVQQMADLDRLTITRWREAIGGRLLDAGCGPGHWTDVLSERGRRDAGGIDGSARILGSARRRFPGNRFVAGDLSALPFASQSVGGILAWHSVVHAPPAELPEILDEFTRALTPGGSPLQGFFASRISTLRW